MNKELRTFQTPTTRESLSNLVTLLAREHCDNTELLKINPDLVCKTIQDEIAEMAVEFKDTRALRAGCGKYKTSARQKLFEAFGEESVPEIEELQKMICIEIDFIFHQEWLEATLELLCEYCETHSPRVSTWGMGSIKSWFMDGNRSFGGNFYRFWRRRIEPKGDEIFKELILEKLPEKWQQCYKLRERTG